MRLASFSLQSSNSMHRAAAMDNLSAHDSEGKKVTFQESPRLVESYYNRHYITDRLVFYRKLKDGTIKYKLGLICFPSPLNKYSTPMVYAHFETQQIFNLLRSQDDVYQYAPKILRGDIIDHTFGLSGKHRVTVFARHQKIYIDIREFDRNHGKTVPSYRGITLNMEEYTNFVNRLMALDFQEIRDYTPCYMTDSHNNQEGAMACAYCNPFGDDDVDYSMY